MLVPGGWVQLLETCPETKLDHSGPNMTRIVNALSTLYEMRGLVHDLPYIIDRLLTKTGFVNVQRRTIVIAPRAGISRPKHVDTDSDTDEDRGCMIHQTIIFEFLGAAKKGLLKTSLFESEEEFDIVLKGMEKEWDEWSSDGGWSYTVLYAQKPSI